jgi:transposase InsO family protein
LEDYKLFPNYGLPEVIYSDGGPQFLSNDFAQMCQMYGIKHFTSSPEYAQSNGLAESTVKQMKRILHCCHDTWNHRIDNGKLLEAVLLFQNTPRKLTDLSSAELMFGHQICDRIPTPHHLYLPQYKTAIEKKLQEAKLAPATSPTSIAATWNKGVHPGQPY